MLAYNIEHESKLYVILGAQESKNAVAYHIQFRDPEPASCGNSVTNGIHVHLSREVQWLRVRDAIMLRSTHDCRLVPGYSSFDEYERELAFRAYGALLPGTRYSVYMPADAIGTSEQHPLVWSEEFFFTTKTTPEIQLYAQLDNPYRCKRFTLKLKKNTCPNQNFSLLQVYVADCFRLTYGDIQGADLHCSFGGPETTSLALIDGDAATLMLRHNDIKRVS